MKDIFEIGTVVIVLTKASSKFLQFGVIREIQNNDSKWYIVEFKDLSLRCFLRSEIKAILTDY